MQSAKIRIKVLAIMTSVALLALPAAAFSIGGVMDDMINDYENFDEEIQNTDPASRIDAQQRGYMSGGGVRVRMDPGGVNVDSWVSVQDPSFTASCSGIDAHLGSLSWISADKIIEQFKSLADPSVAIYALYLSMKQMCDSCASVSSFIQEQIIDKLDMLNASCEDSAQKMAEWGEEGARYLQEKVSNQTSGEGGEDAAEIDEQDHLSEAVKDDELVEKNLLLDHMEDVVFESGPGTGLSENELKMIVMSFAGTKVQRVDEEEKGGGLTYTDVANSVPDIEQLAEEGVMEGLVCEGYSPGDSVDPKDCLETEQGVIAESLTSSGEEASLEGIVDQFLSTNKDNSLVNRFAIHHDVGTNNVTTPQGETTDWASMTDQEFSFIGRSRLPILALIQRFAYTQGTQPPQAWLDVIAKQFAIDAAYRVMREAKDVAKKAAANIDSRDSVDMTQIEENIDESWRDIQSQRDQYSQKIASKLSNIDLFLSVSGMPRN